MAAHHGDKAEIDQIVSPGRHTLISDIIEAYIGPNGLYFLCVVL